jgi:hypothetical protein
MPYRKTSAVDFRDYMQSINTLHGLNHVSNVTYPGMYIQILTTSAQIKTIG